MKTQRRTADEQYQLIMECRSSGLSMGFSLLRALEFFVDPKNGNARNLNPPAMRVETNRYTKKSPFRYNRVVQALLQERKGDFMAKKNNDLAHTKWMCKYHIVFTPKYRRKIIYNQLKVDIRDILKQLCSYKGVEIIEGHLMPDHIYMLVSISPKMSVSSFMGYLKGKSALMIFDRHANLKYKFGNRHFWCRGYYVDTVGKNAKKIEEYIRNQLKEDLEYDQMSLKEYIDPFTGNVVNLAKIFQYSCNIQYLWSILEHTK